jgi:hypothetical protein
VPAKSSLRLPRWVTTMTIPLRLNHWMNSDGVFCRSNLKRRRRHPKVARRRE